HGLAIRAHALDGPGISGGSPPAVARPRLHFDGVRLLWGEPATPDQPGERVEKVHGHDVEPLGQRQRAPIVGHEREPLASGRSGKTERNRLVFAEVPGRAQAPTHDRELIPRCGAGRERTPIEAEVAKVLPYLRPDARALLVHV